MSSLLPVARVLLCCHRWIHPTWVRGAIGRLPAITFPQRRTPDGKPLVILSLDHLRAQPTTQTVQNSLQHKRHQTLDLPASYGRKPLTEEEIEVINLGGEDNR